MVGLYIYSPADHTVYPSLINTQLDLQLTGVPDCMHEGYKLGPAVHSTISMYFPKKHRKAYMAKVFRLISAKCQKQT